MSEHLWMGSVQKEERRCQGSWYKSNGCYSVWRELVLHLRQRLQRLKRLHNNESIGAYFVIRGKTNNDFKPMKWKRRFPPESGIQSDAIGYMAGQLMMEKYPDKIRRVIYLDKESKKKFIFFTNALTISPVMVAELYHNRGRSSFSSSGSSRCRQDVIYFLLWKKFLWHPAQNNAFQSMKLHLVNKE